MRRLIVCLPLLLAVLFADCPKVWSALTIQNYNAAQHDRFANNASFIGNGFNWSGVGRTGAGIGTWGTLVTPSFVVTATHFAGSGPIRFYTSNDPNGGFVERNIVQNITLTQVGADRTSDFTISRLDSAVTGVNLLPILDLPTNADYLNKEIYVFGISNGADSFTNVRLGRNTIDDVLLQFSDPALNAGNSKNDVFIYDFDNPGGVGADEARIESGDSGAPSFMIVNGAPALVGVHWFQYGVGDFGSPNIGSGDTFVSSFIDEINAAIAATGSAERVLTISAVPEPSTLILVASALGAALCNRRMRKLLSFRAAL